VRPSGFCYWHDPDLAPARAEARRRGGSHRSNAARARKALSTKAMTAAELQGLLAVVLDGVVAGETAPGVGNCVANLVRTAVAVREAVEVEARLAALEQRLDDADAHAYPGGRG
jgi:hypothetical protein